MPPITKSLKRHELTMSLIEGVSTMIGKGGRSYAPYIALLPLGAKMARREWKGAKELALCEVTTYADSVYHEIID